MPTNLSLPKKEPVALIVAGLAVIQAAIGCAVAFGFAVSDEQRDAILYFVGVTAVFLVVIIPLIRSQVTPNAKVVEAVEGETVVAGEANDVIPNGQPVRELGGEALDADLGNPEADLDEKPQRLA